MTNILESMMAKPDLFSPQTVEEYIGLQLARKLGDTAHLTKYLLLCSNLALEEILKAYAHTANHTGQGALTLFDEYITKLSKQADDTSF